MSKSKSNKMKVKQKELHPNVILLPAPKGVDIDIVSEIIGDDNWDIIFLDDAIVCTSERVNDVLEAYQEYLDDVEEDDEE